VNLESCATRIRHSKIKVEERGKSAVILNPNRRTFLRVQVDGCLPLIGPRADWVIERSRAAVVVELKGRGIEHGAAQIMATARLWKDEGRVDRVCGLIVGASPPRARTSIQVRQDVFNKKFRSPLHVVRQNTEYVWDHLFSFKGPFRAS
jgi:hypothetical protein